MRKSAFHRSALFRVSILIALLCLFIMAYSANALYLGWTNDQQAARLGPVVEMTQSFSDGLKNFMFERGRTNAVLTGQESSSLACDTMKLTVTMTFGAAEYSAGESIHETVRHADMALLQGKNSGRNQVVVYKTS